MQRHLHRPRRAIASRWICALAVWVALFTPVLADADQAQPPARHGADAGLHPEISGWIHAALLTLQLLTYIIDALDQIDKIVEESAPRPNPPPQTSGPPWEPRENPEPISIRYVE
jgi:hypothetical protein